MTLTDFRPLLFILPLVIPFSSIALSCEPEVIFEENFEDTSDWVSENENVVPEKWTAVRAQKRWSPATNHVDRHFGQEIHSKNMNKARNNKGKSWVKWRESYNPGWSEWNSDNILAKVFDSGFDDLYVSFYIKFSPNWKGDESASKLFRIFYWNGDRNKLWSGFSGGLGPMLLWDYGANTYGLRNIIALRGGPAGHNYSFSQKDISGLPRQIIGLGDMSLNFTSDTKGINMDSTDPVMVSMKTGKIIPKDNYTVSHDDVFSSADGWSKVEFYVRMNSSVDATDGLLMQWINGSLVFNSNKIPWNRATSDGTAAVKWNGFAIGGNDFFNSVPNSERYEEWYSIDDISVSTNIPDWFIKLKSISGIVKK